MTARHDIPEVTTQGRRGYGNETRRHRGNAVIRRQTIVGPVAKSAYEVLKIAITSNWREGICNDTKRRFRTVSGAVLWRDTDGNRICRVTTYNFFSDHPGGNDWSPAAFKSFRLSCPKGYVECP